MMSQIEYKNKYWERILEKNFLGVFIPIPKSCPLCKYNILHSYENETLNNPILYRCNKCKKVIYIRELKIYGKFPCISASLIHIIIKLWIIEQLNTTQIF